MATNLDRFKKELEGLIAEGALLDIAFQLAYLSEASIQKWKEQYGPDKADKLIKTLPRLPDGYQLWYSEAKALIKQLMPDRLNDFVSHYERPKARKEITHANYTIEDALQGLGVIKPNGDKLAGPDSAIPQFRQQLAILKSVERRFESSLFDIRQLVQADLFDSELDAAEELSKYNFLRAAGALAGVVLEKHLRQVTENHQVKITKKNHTIAVLNDALKDEKIIDQP